MALHREQWDVPNMMKDLFQIGFDMLLSKLHKIMVNKVTFVGFRRVDHPNCPSHWVSPHESKRRKRKRLGRLLILLVRKTLKVVA